jgi:hypothetical protein
MLSNVVTLERINLKRLDIDSLQILALARLSIPSWTQEQLLTVFRGCNGLLEVSDFLLHLSLPQCWRSMKVCAEIGDSISIFPILKLDAENAIMHAYTQCFSVLQLVMGENQPSLEEVCWRAVKWLVRWEYWFVEWRSLLVKTNLSIQYRIRCYLIYYLLAIIEHHARRVLVSALKGINSTDSAAKSLLQYLQIHPITMARLEYVLSGPWPIKENTFKHTKYTNTGLVNFLDSFQSVPQPMKDLQAKIHEGVKSTNGTNVFIDADSDIASLLASMFPKLQNQDKGSKDMWRENNARIGKAIPMLITRFAPKEQARAWQVRWSICQAVDFNGRITDMDSVRALLDTSSNADGHLPLSDLAFIDFIISESNVGQS